MDTGGENVECCYPKSAKECMSWWPCSRPAVLGGKWFLPGCLCFLWRCWAWHREGWDYLWLSSCCVDAHLSIPCAVNNLLTQPWFTPTPSRYLHLPLSNRFFLWLLKLTHFDILRGEKWEVLLEIALMGCTGEALFEEQAQESPLWALF